MAIDYRQDVKSTCDKLLDRLSDSGIFTQGNINDFLALVDSDLENKTIKSLDWVNQKFSEYRKKYKSDIGLLSDLQSYTRSLIFSNHTNGLYVASLALFVSRKGINHVQQFYNHNFLSLFEEVLSECNRLFNSGYYIASVVYDTTGRNPGGYHIVINCNWDEYPINNSDFVPEEYDFNILFVPKYPEKTLNRMLGIIIDSQLEFLQNDGYIDIASQVNITSSYIPYFN